MTRLGVPWDRSTVAKLETGRRGMVSVPELLALAVALEVTPAALLVDLDSPQYEVTPALSVTPVDMVAWLWGYGPLPGQDPGAVAFPHRAAPLVRALAALWVRLSGVEHQEEDEVLTSPASRDAYLKDSRRGLRYLATSVADKGVTVPAEITDYLAKHADD